MANKIREERFTVRFLHEDGAEQTEHPLPLARAERIAHRGISHLGRFHGGTAEIVGEDGEVFISIEEIPEPPHPIYGDDDEELPR